MKKAILTSILGLVVTALAFATQPGNSLMNEPVVDLDTITYIEEESPVELGFDTRMYLPESFNAYGIPQNFMDISFIEAEHAFVLDFDTEQYLPKGFDPFKTYFDLDSIQYIEEEDILEYDFEIYQELPADASPATTF